MSESIHFINHWIRQGEIERFVHVFFVNLPFMGVCVCESNHCCCTPLFEELGEMMCYIYTGIRVMCFLQIDWVESTPADILSAALNLTFFFSPCIWALNFTFTSKCFLKCQESLNSRLQVWFIWASGYEPEYKSLQAVQERVYVIDTSLGNTLSFRGVYCYVFQQQSNFLFLASQSVCG